MTGEKWGWILTLHTVGLGRQFSAGMTGTADEEEKAEDLAGELGTHFSPDTNYK